MRASGREAGGMRPVTIEPGWQRHAEGSCLIRVGATEVLCAASVDARVPPFLRGRGEGWVTAEYGMLPRATHRRGEREAARGRQTGRTVEIQRLIGRSLRAITDRTALGELTVMIDCDVLNADGGTRCAAITGGYVALALALGRRFTVSPLRDAVAAVSVGLDADGTALLDLDYGEDSAAATDGNFVLTGGGALVEVQASAEAQPFTVDALDRMLALARAGASLLFAAQRDALAGPGGVRDDGPGVARGGA